MLYEYACHEGNYALPHSGRREEERMAAVSGEQAKRRALEDDEKGE